MIFVVHFIIFLLIFNITYVLNEFSNISPPLNSFNHTQTTHDISQKFISISIFLVHTFKYIYSIYAFFSFFYSMKKKFNFNLNVMSSKKNFFFKFSLNFDIKTHRKKNTFESHIFKKIYIYKKISSLICINYFLIQKIFTPLPSKMQNEYTLIQIYFKKIHNLFYKYKQTREKKE